MADSPTTLDQILDSVARVVPADLYSILEFEEGDVLRVRAAHGRLASPRVVGHVVKLALRPSLAAALRGESACLLSGDPGEEHHHDEPDTFEGVVRLPGDHSCLAAPLVAGSKHLGAMTLDAATCGAFSPEAIRAVEAFAHLAALTIDSDERASRLERDLERLAAQHAMHDDGTAARAGLVGRSPAWTRVVEQVRLVAPTPTSVLITGDTGTGKEQVARAIHRWSTRAAGPFVAFNGSLAVGDLALSELFGHERGAFTGADRQRAGRFELARGGTLFLDEVAELPAAAQAQLLRVVQERVFERVGGSRPIEADVRLVAATHRDLGAAVAAGRFREDLYYRLAAFPIALPPLSARPGDVALLTTHLLKVLRGELGMTELSISPSAIRRLEEHTWPGNVRELRNALERAAILARGQAILPRHLDRLDAPAQEGRAAAPAVALARADVDLPAGLSRLEQAQAREILAALRESDGRIAGADGAAAKLGLPPTTLHSTMKRLGLSRDLDSKARGGFRGAR